AAALVDGRQSLLPPAVSRYSVWPDYAGGGGRGTRTAGPRGPARDSARVRHREHVERGIELLHRELAALHEAESDRRLTHRDALGDGVLGDLRRVLVADELVERRDDRGRHARERGGALHVRLAALDGLVGEHTRAVREQADRLEQRRAHHRDRHVEL